METFRNLALAYEAMRIGGNKACVLNASNEIAVEAFLQDKIKFLQIAEINESCMNKIDLILNPKIDDYMMTDFETRKFAKTLIK